VAGHRSHFRFGPLTYHPYRCNRQAASHRKRPPIGDVRTDARPEHNMTAISGAKGLLPAPAPRRYRFTARLALVAFAAVTVAGCAVNLSSPQPPDTNKPAPIASSTPAGSHRAPPRYQRSQPRKSSLFCRSPDRVGSPRSQLR